MSTALTTSPASLPQKLIALNERKALGITDKAWDRMKLIKSLCLQCIGLAHGTKKAKYAELAASTGGMISASTLEDRFNRWVASGYDEHSLLDKSRLKRHGKRASVLHENTVQYWVTLAEKNLHVEHKHELDTFAGAWEKLMREIFTGGTVPGLGSHGKPGTWRELYLRIEQQKPKARQLPVPDACRWSLTEIPKGHSLTNFRDRHNAMEESQIAVRGTKSLKLSLPMMRMSYADLPCLRVVQPDDFDTEFAIRAYNPYLKREMITAVHALVFIDVATRKVVSFAVYLAHLREDGKETGIQRRDMQHCIAHLLHSVGLPKDGEIIFRCENATAAITHEFEEMLTRASGGRIKVSRTPVWKHQILPDGMVDSWGASNRKGIVENWIGQLMRRMGYAPGQQGANWTMKPRAAQALLEDAKAMLKEYGERATDEEMPHIIPHDDLPKLMARFEEVIHDMETNPLHNREGFKTTKQWRVDESAAWRPENDELMLKFLATKGPEFVDAITNQPGCSRTVKETVLERWERLYNPADFEKLPLSTVYYFYLDVAPGKWTARFEIEAKLSRGPVFVFRGEVDCPKGHKVNVHFDADRPGMGCVLVDAATGLPIGTMEFRQSGTWGDFPWMAQQNKDKDLVEESLLTPLNRRHAVLPGQDRKSRRLKVIRDIEERELLQAPENTAALAVVQGFEGRGKRAARPAPAKALPAVAEGHDLDLLEREVASLTGAVPVPVKAPFDWMNED